MAKLAVGLIGDKLNSEDELDIRQYTALLWKRAWILITITGLFIALAGAYSLSKDKVYQASARVVLSSQQDNVAAAGALSDPNAFQSQVGTQVQVVKSPPVADAANKVLGATSAQVLSISASGVANTRLMEISAQSKSPAVAAQAANAYTNAYLTNRSDSAVGDVLNIGQSVQAKQLQLQQQINDLTKRLASKPSNADDLNNQIAALNAQVGSLQQQYTQVQAQATVRDSGASLLSQAVAPTSQISPKPLRNMAVAAVLGLLIAIGMVLLLERVDDRIRNEDDIERFVPGVSLLASIPRVQNWKNEAEAKTVTLLEPNSPAAEAYRRLRTSVEFVGLDLPLQVIEVTSATAAEGKSTTVANLATALAWGGKKVIVVAADLRRPRVHEFLHVSNGEGFTSILLSGNEISSVLQHTAAMESVGSVDVLATGPLPPNPAELLGGQRVRTLFEVLRKHADYIIIDSPPVLPVADPLVLSTYADGVVMVAGVGKLRRRQLDRAMGLMSKAKAPIIGILLNGVGTQSSDYRYEQSYYGQSNKIKAKKKDRKAAAAGAGDVTQANAPEPAWERAEPIASARDNARLNDDSDMAIINLDDKAKKKRRRKAKSDS